MPQTNRYPGVRPFETEDQALFFGRTRDIADLGDLIALERLVVLFGKSGYGKSSLINAGILPRLTEVDDADEAPLVPVVVRLGSYVAGAGATPKESLLARLDEKAPVAADSTFLDALLPERTLWYQFKRRQTPEKQRFLLIFDQFEEFFTYPAAQQATFKTQLAALLYQDTPQNVREAAPTFSKDQRRLLAQTLEVKVLLAIRADRMSLLDSMKDQLPSILEKRYELKGLTEAQAQEAITQPARIAGAQFATTPFEYTRPALDKIIAELSENHSKPIESFLVQIVCEEIEKNVQKGHITDLDGNGLPDVDVQNLPDFDNLYENYYRRKIGELPPSVQTAAQWLIEEKLIFEEAQTGEARRLSVDKGVLQREQGVTETLLNQLESTFLLRRESNSTGGFSYEVSHDTMIAPILKSKSARQAQERAEAARQEARRRQRRFLAIIGAGALVLAVVVGVGVYMYRQNIRLQSALEEAAQKTKEAEIAQKMAEKRLEDKEIAEFEEVLRGANNILSNEGTINCPSSATLAAIDSMRVKYPQNAALQQKIQEIDLKRKRKNCK